VNDAGGPFFDGIGNKLVAINNGTFYGYKKAVIFYLKKKREILTDIKTKTMIDKKISIITNG
jgi:hypothetical protein